MRTDCGRLPGTSPPSADKTIPSRYAHMRPTEKNGRQALSVTDVPNGRLRGVLITGVPPPAYDACRREDGRRRRPPAGPALKFVEKLLPTRLTSTDTTERNAGMLRVPLVASPGRPGYWLELLVVLVVVLCVSQARLGTAMAWQDAVRQRRLVAAEAEALATHRQRMVEELGRLYAPLGLVVVGADEPHRDGNSGSGLQSED
jgi:hypothetical protein